MKPKHYLVAFFVVVLISGCGKAPPNPTATHARPAGIILPTNTPSPTREPTLTQSPTTAPLPVFIADEFDVPMALISASAFKMGSDNGEADEAPIHTVSLDAFYMDQYEVTNRRYLACVDAGICSEHNRTELYDPNFGEYPIRNISWNEAQTYCKWRGAHLPTEAQWEKAARGNLEGKYYPWGDDGPICDIGVENGAKFDDGGSCHDTGTESVGSYEANGYGLYDMAGNLLEWTADWYSVDYYANSPVQDPQGPRNGEFKVVRGGSWHTGATTLRVFHRYGNLPRFAYNLLGFRCVKPAK